MRAMFAFVDEAQDSTRAMSCIVTPPLWRRIAWVSARAGCGRSARRQARTRVARAAVALAMEKWLDERRRARSAGGLPVRKTIMGMQRIIVLVLVALTLAGCASRPVNERLTQVDPKAGYRPHLLIPKRIDNDSGTLFVLAFSGGGTRAAALSYGVLDELRRTDIVVHGKRRRLVDEVDVITGVSGGSFTALAYALYGDRLFAEYEQRFLKRDVQGELLRRALNPFYWPQYVGGTAGRSELAADFYDEILFEGATYADLLGETGPGGDRERHRHHDRIAAFVLPERFRPAVHGPVHRAAVARGGHVVRGARRPVRGDLDTTNTAAGICALAVMSHARGPCPGPRQRQACRCPG